LNKENGVNTIRPKPFIIIVGIAVLLLIFTAMFISRVHVVDARPAVAFGNEYFSKLKKRQVDAALEMYTDGFRQQKGKEWQSLLSQLDAQNGGVTDSTTLGSGTLPVRLRESTEIACVLVQYQVARDTLITKEKLTLCPHQRGTEFGIASHEITRSDNGLRYEAGITVREKTIFSTK
jgi:hypothetical protein